MKKRIFIAINLPEDLKNSLIFYQRKINGLFVRWTKKDSLHLTLVFIGYVLEEDIEKIYQAVSKATKKFKPFTIIFDKIEKDEFLRMIWLKGRVNQSLLNLKKELEKNLSAEKNIFFQPEKRIFKPHITLARVKPEAQTFFSKTKVSEDFFVNLKVASIEIMESHLKKDGAEYSVLKSFSLGGQVK